MNREIKDVHHTLLQKQDGQFYRILRREVLSFDNREKKDIAVSERKITCLYRSPYANLTVDLYRTPAR